MNVRRVLRIAAVAAWGIGLAPVLPTFGQSSSPTLDAVGWWNKTQALPVQGNPSGLDDPTGLGLTTAPTVPAPATVPEDGLYVANDASGPTAISAVRYLAGGGGSLTLSLADGAAPTGTEAIVACPVQGGFTPAQNGRWDAKPGYDPASCSIAGTIDATAATVTFELPSTLASSLGDIAVVIAPDPKSTTPFSLPFAKPDNSSFVVTSPSMSSGGSTFTPSESAYTPGSPVFSPSAPSSSPSFSTPAAPAASAPVDAGEVAAPVVPVEAAPATAVASDDRTAQVGAVLILLAIGGALWWLANHPQRAPRLLGSVGGAAGTVEPAPVLLVSQRPRGVGRFSRPRDIPATPL